MPFAVSHDQIYFFKVKHLISFEEWFSQEEIAECTRLLKKLVEERSKTPAALEEHTVRNCPPLVKLLRKKEVGDVAFRLTGYKPWQVVYDCFFTGNTPLPDLQKIPAHTHRIGFVLALAGPEAGRGTYFALDSTNTLKFSEGQSYLLLVLSQAGLPDVRSPFV